MEAKQSSVPEGGPDPSIARWHSTFSMLVQRLARLVLCVDVALYGTLWPSGSSPAFGCACGSIAHHANAVREPDIITGSRANSGRAHESIFANGANPPFGLCRWALRKRNIFPGCVLCTEGFWLLSGGLGVGPRLPRFWPRRRERPRKSASVFAWAFPCELAFRCVSLGVCGGAVPLGLVGSGGEGVTCHVVLCRVITSCRVVSCHDVSCAVRSGQVRSGQVGSGQVRSGQVRSGQVMSCRVACSIA